MQFKERKRGRVGIFITLLVVIVGVAGGYIYLSPVFEQNKPHILSKESLYWNLKSPIKIDLHDESGIKYYKVTFKDGQKNTILAQEVLSEVKKEITIQIPAPKLDMFYQGVETTLEIEAVDNSKWNFLEGNRAVKTIKLTIDTQKPIANVIENSRYIQRGGSAVVVVKVKDINLDEAFIVFNDRKKFQLIPYYEKDHYAALIAWPIEIEEFERVNLIAIDKAGNKTISKVPLYIQKKRIKAENITITESFIKNISASVLEQSFEPIPENLEDIFLYSNINLREKNIKTIEEITHKHLDNQFVEEFRINSMDRLPGSKTVSGYGEKRHYYLDGRKINEAWHLGIDWASVKKAPISVSNDGVVIFNSYLGLYGNTIIIDHGMGLATLYAHTSSQSVKVGDSVVVNQKIANTGATGAVFGDHLHFGVLVQGVEVNPVEWMDRNWIKVRITDVLTNAKKSIDGK